MKIKLELNGKKNRQKERGGGKCRQKLYSMHCKKGENIFFKGELGKGNMVLGKIIKRISFYSFFEIFCEIDDKNC
jgi:hypothetical protein